MWCVRYGMPCYHAMQCYAMLCYAMLGSSASLAPPNAPTHVEAAKINNLLRTNPQSTLAQMIDFPVAEGGLPRNEHAQRGPDA